MIKEILKKIFSNIPMICLIITFTLFFSTIHEAKRLNKLREETLKQFFSTIHEAERLNKLREETLKHYYNKFCTEYYDLSCDKIKIK